MPNGKNYLRMLSSFKGLPDGTYDANKKPVQFRSGYQVTFHQSGIKYSMQEYDFLTDKIAILTNSKVYIGVYGKPEVSFHCKDRTLAIQIAEQYNQYSIWDWSIDEEILNIHYDPSATNPMEE